jgi:hypothetical protein
MTQPRVLLAVLHYLEVRDHQAVFFRHAGKSVAILQV